MPYSKRSSIGIWIAVAGLVWAIIWLLSMNAYADAVSLQPVYDAVNPSIETVLEGLAVAAVALAWFVARKIVASKYCPAFLKRWIVERAMKRVDRIVQNAVDSMLDWTKSWQTAHQDIEIQGRIKATATRWAIAYAAKDVKRAGLDLEQIANMAIAKIPVPPGEPGVAAPVIEVERRELPPIGGK